MSDQPTPPRHGGPEPTQEQIAEWQGEVAVLITCANIRASVAERLSDLFARFLAALDAERNNRLAADEAMVTLHEALQKAETELDAERRRAEQAEARCTAAEVDRVDHALAAQQRMLDALKAENAALRQRAEAELNAPESERLKAMQAVVSAQAREVTEMCKCVETATDSAISACAAAARMQAERDALSVENSALRQEVAGLLVWLEDAADTLEQYDGDLARGHAAEIRAFLEKQP